jgi:hypothetical protein
MNCLSESSTKPKKNTKERINKKYSAPSSSEQLSQSIEKSSIYGENSE